MYCKALRVFLSIFDQTLTAHFLKTDDARTNRFLLLKQLTSTVHDDAISDETAPSSGSSELINFKTWNAIYFCYSYPILMTIPPFDWKLNLLSQMGFQSWNFCQKAVFCLKMGFFWKVFGRNFLLSVNIISRAPRGTIGSLNILLRLLVVV